MNGDKKYRGFRKLKLKKKDFYMLIDLSAYLEQQFRKYPELVRDANAMRVASRQLVKAFLWKYDTFDKNRASKESKDDSKTILLVKKDFYTLLALYSSLAPRFNKYPVLADVAKSMTEAGYAIYRVATLKYKRFDFKDYQKVKKRAKL